MCLFYPLILRIPDCYPGKSGNVTREIEEGKLLRQPPGIGTCQTGRLDKCQIVTQQITEIVTGTWGTGEYFIGHSIHNML